MIVISMMKRLLFTLLLFGVLYTSWGQLNDYKYIVVPKKFTSLKSENHLRTSTLIKHLFNKAGFTALYDDEIREDLVNDPCLAATTDLIKESTMFQTKITLLLKDCEGEVIFTAVQGSSRNKDYQQAYHESIKKSFVSFENMNYQYKPSEKEDSAVTVSYEGDIKQVEGGKEAQMASEAVVIQVATPDEQLYKSNEPEPSEYKKGETAALADKKVIEEEEKETFQAKALPNGYELISENTQVKLTLYKTSSPDVYLAKNDEQNGMVYKKESKWYFEFYDNTDLVVREIDIIFQ